MESCGMSLIKYVLFIFNLIFSISGIGIIVAGALVLADVDEIGQFADNELLAPPIVLIVTGAIIFIIAFLGCFGAIRESYKLLMTFAVLLLVIFMMELAAGIAAAVYKNDFEKVLENKLQKSLELYHESERDKLAWDNVQLKFRCCGITSKENWPQGHVPYSCCNSDDEEKNEPSSYCVNSGVGKFMNNMGCYSKLQTKIHSNANVLIGVGIGIAFIQILGIVLACWLAYTIKKENGEK